jgi:hypothetical protein
VALTGLRCRSGTLISSRWPVSTLSDRNER